jgi:hypothetical protein
MKPLRARPPRQFSYLFRDGSAVFTPDNLILGPAEPLKFAPVILGYFGATLDHFTRL